MVAPPVKLLLVEDNRGDAVLVKEYLAHCGEIRFEVETADSLSIALKQLKKNDVDVILLDLGLPDSQGLDTFRKVRAEAPELAIVVQTGEVDSIQALQALQEGAQDYLTKGTMKEETLVRSLRYAVERNRFRRALGESEHRYKSLLNSTTDYIYTVQVENGRVVATRHGPGCEAVTGYCQVEFQADPHLWYRMIHEEDGAAVLAQAAKILAGEKVQPLEHRIRHKNGSLRWVRNTPVAHKDARGGVIAYDGLISDITERMQAQEALRLSEHRYRFLFENNLAGILVSTLDGEILNCNLAFAQILGFSGPEEMKSHRTWDFYYDPGERQAMLVQLQKQGQLRNHELRFRRQDGTPAWVLANISLIQEGFETPILHGTAFDVTQKKQALESLQTAENIYQSLVEGIPVSVFRKDLKGRFTFANQRFCQSLGKPLEQILGKTDFDFYPPSLAGKYHQDDQKVFTSGDIFQDTEMHREPVTGERFYVTVVKVPVYDANRKIVGIQGGFWDITASRWVEEHQGQLQVARAIQRQLLPKKDPSLPGFDIAGVSHPAEATGGDYFDFFPINRGSLGIVVGDVSGHGFGPALLAAVTHACLRTLALTEMDIDLDVILATGNRLLYQDTKGDRFVSLIIAKVHPETHSLEYTNAGHPPGFVLDADGEVKAVLHSTGPVLGILPEADFFLAPTIPLAPGDLVLLFSDGVLDTMAPDGKQFGKERMLEAVRRNRQHSAKVISHALCREIEAFRRGEPAHDDVTVVIIKAEAKP